MTTDALYTVLGHLSREWGEYGYRVVGLRSDWYGGGVVEISHSDGSRFYIATDRHGATVASGDTEQAAVDAYVAAYAAKRDAAHAASLA